MTVLAEHLYKKADNLVRANPLLAGIAKDVANEAHPASEGTEWAKSKDVHIGPTPFEFLLVGMVNILTYRVLYKYVEQLVFVGEKGETQSAPEAVLCLSEEFEGLPDIDFFSTGNEIQGYDHKNAVREILKMMGKSHGRIYKFLSMPNWSLNALGIAEFFPNDLAHKQLKLAIDLPRLPSDEKIASVVDFRNDPDKRFAEAWLLAQTNNTPLKKNELAEHLKLSVENKAFAILWDRLSLAGANIKKPGRPKEK